MAYLPTVDDFKEADDSYKESFASSILDKIKSKRLSSQLVSKSVSIRKNIEKTFTIEKENSNEDILTKLYTFIVTDHKRKQLMSDEKRNRIAKIEKESGDRLYKIVSALGISDKDKTKTEDKKTFGLGLGLFVTAGAGILLYKNLDELKKLFDIKKIESDIEKLTDEFDMSNVVNNITTVINDVLDEIKKLKMPDLNFDFGDVSAGTGKGSVDVTLEKLPSASDIGVSSDEMGLRKILKKGEAETYNTMVGGKQVDLTSKTVDEVLKYQESLPKGRTAAGKYQIIKSTLESAKKNMKLTGKEKFDPAMQDKIYREYLTGEKRPGLQKYLSGKDSDIESAQIELAKEFSSVPVPRDMTVVDKDGKTRNIKRGQSYYEGIGGNRANLSIEETQRALIEERGIRTGQIAVKPTSVTPSDTAQRQSKTYDFKPLQEKKAFIIHHTAGRGNVGGVMSTFEQTKNFAHFVIDREGNIYRTVPEGMRGTHMIKGSGKGEGLSNINTEGVEIIAKDDKDVLPVQVEAAKKLAASLGYKPEQIFGHGEVNPGHKQASEGMTVVSSIRKEGLKPVSGVKILDYTKKYKSEKITTDKHLQMHKDLGEPGELGDNDSARIPAPTSSGTTKYVSNEDRKNHKITWNPASDKDLIGIKFNSHPGLPSHLDSMITVEQARTVQALRSALGKNTLTVKSGFRPPWYNKTRKGAADNSLHKFGKACDISTDGMSTEEIVKFVRAASKVGFGGIAYYPTMNFVHCDIGSIRTWPTTGRTPASIQRAINEHVGSRHGQLAPGANNSAGTIPDLSEPGELPNNVPSKPLPGVAPTAPASPASTPKSPDVPVGQPSPPTEEVDTEPKTISEYISQQMEDANKTSNLISSAVNLMKENDVTKINQLLDQFTQNIPRQEKSNKASSMINSPVTNVFNNIREENNYNQNNTLDDSPSIFLNPVLAELNKIIGVIR